MVNNIASGITESAIDNIGAVELVDTDSGIMPDDIKQIDDETNTIVNVSYERRLRSALSDLKKQVMLYLAWKTYKC